jgi:DNA-binding response OmpR family regulator
MPPVRKILIADPDPETVRLLAPPLRQRGYQVYAARDGSRALQVAILRFPDLIILDEQAPLLDARTFVRILRTNPRTERIPVLLTGEGDDQDRIRLGTWLRKPLRVDEVLARVDHLLRRAEASRAAGAAVDLEGNLAQIPLTDLLQILAVNRRSGRLQVERGGEKAEVALRAGRVVDATFGLATGEKALWRLLTHHEGQFVFAPGEPAGPDRIERRLDDLMLEGLRQADELARLLPALPPPAEVVELAMGAEEIPVGLHPVTAEVVAQLATPRRVGELIDRCAASDLEASRALLAMLEHGYARLAPAAPSPGEPPPLLAPHELHALRARVARGRASGARTIGKVVVAGGGPLSRKAALARFASLPGYQPSPEEPGPFGTLGRLSLGEGVRIDLVELPGEPEHRPLWRPFGAGAVGALVLLPVDGDGLLEELVRALQVPVVVCGPVAAELPGPLRDTGGGGVASGGSDAAEALRALLAGAGARAAAY